MMQIRASGSLQIDNSPGTDKLSQSNLRAFQSFYSLLRTAGLRSGMGPTEGVSRAVFDKHIIFVRDVTP